MALVLTADEKWLLEQIRVGKPASFVKETVVNPAVLRDGLLGFAESQGTNGTSRPLGPCLVHKAEFKEPLDLTDGRQGSGGSLAAIEFVECRFHAGFCADGADLERLAFKRCFFVGADTAEAPAPAGMAGQPEAAGATEGVAPESGLQPAPEQSASSAPKLPDAEPSFERRRMKNCISLRNCRIRTELRLEDLAPTDPEGGSGVLYVDGFAAVVGTNVVVRNTLLRAPQNEPSSTDPEPRYALDLSTAEIGSDLQLMPAVKLFGGLKMRDARVGGTFWGAGLTVSDGETAETRAAIQNGGSTTRAALRLETTTVKGNLVLGTDNGRLVQEAIRLRWMRARANDTSRFVLAPFIEPFRTTIDGSAELQSATVEGTVDMSQCVVKGTLNLVGLNVRGSFVASQGLDDQARRILPLEPRESTKFPLQIDGSVFLNNARIDGDLYLEVEVEVSLVMNGAELGGSATLNGTVPRFEGTGMKTANDIALAFKGVSFCGLEGARIGGGLDLRHSALVDSARLSLENCEVHHSINFADPVGAPEAVNRRPLCCYPGFHLTEVLFADQGRHTIAAYITYDRPSDEPESTYLPILLDGRAKHIHRLNRGLLKLAIHRGSHEEPVGIDPPLRLETECQVRTYLRFFCAFLWGERGSFSLITHVRDLPASAKPDPKILRIRCAVTRNDKGEKVWEARAYERYSDSAFAATFHISDTGEVEMMDDEWVGRYEGEELARLSTFEPPYRIPPVPDGDTAKLITSYRSDFRGWTRFSGSAADIARFKRDALWWETLLQGFAGTEVYLNGATCRRLNDNAAFVWKRVSKLEMESFDYQEVYIPKSSDDPLDELGTRLDMVRGNLDRPETSGQSFRYFLLTLLSLPVFPFVIAWITTRWGWVRSDFRADPYTHLARVLRERGDDQPAREVEAEKIWQGVVARGNTTRWGKLSQIYWWRPYGVMFRYGLSPLRAAVSVLVIWILGWIVVSTLSNHHMLQAAVTRVAPAAQIASGQPIMIAMEGKPGMMPDMPCGDAIEPGLYSFELLTPILNLHQESRCGLRTDPYAPDGPTISGHRFRRLAFLVHPTFWEYAKALYMLVGSVISSLAVLTFSGIARRWEH